MEQTPPSNPQSNPFAGMHKQRLYSLIIAVVAFITMIFPWATFNTFIGSNSYNGFNGWGWLSFLGIAAVVASAFIGNKEQVHDPMFKNIVMAGFGAIVLGALLFLVTKNSNYPFYSAGFGLWACLVVGLVGLAFLFGMIKIPENK